MNKTKALKLVLILSLAANAVWLLGSAAGYFSLRKSSAQIAREAEESSKKATKEIAAMFSTNDMAALRDQLRGLCLPEDVVSSVVKRLLASRYDAKSQAITNAAIEEARKRPYWRGATTRSFGGLAYSHEQWKELLDLEHDQRDQLRQLFGDDAVSGYTQMRYPFLSAGKAAQMQDLESDYYAMQHETNQEMSGFRMPDDAAKLKLLDAEKQRDIKALLTPDEWEMYELRNSDTANTLKFRLGGFDMTEDEYKTIYSLQSARDEKGETQQEVEAQIKDALGDDRYADYQRAQRQDYQTLQAAAQRFNLAPETVAQTYQVREDTAATAKQISSDKTLDADQKTQAYTALAEQATAQIRANLGDDVGNAYIDNALPWLKKLPAGGAVTISSNGTVNVTPPKPAPAK